MKFLVIDILGVYKAVVSPFLPAACRFEPTCSEYTRQAVQQYGAVKGTWLGLRRLSTRWLLAAMALVLTIAAAKLILTA